MQKLALAFVIACYPQLLRAADVSLADGVLVFAGLIDEASWHAVEEKTGGQVVHRLIITSKGGDVETALHFAEWIFHHRIDVEVPDYCFSSCANYIFPAGARKFISGQGVVGWHGNVSHLLYQAGIGAEQIPAQSFPAMQTLAKAEREFFAEVRVDQFLCWAGTLAPYSAKNAYILSVEDMAYFGLRNLHVRSDYVRSDLAKWNREDPGKLVYLKLDHGIVEAIRPPLQ